MTVKKTVRPSFFAITFSFPFQRKCYFEMPQKQIDLQLESLIFAFI